MSGRPSLLAQEQLRRIAAKSTEHIALRVGRSLPMYIGCGYPKSGTVWLCQLLSSCLGLPYPQNYLLPVAMRSVIHAHWSWDPRLPPTAYIVRDGRDVMVSFYFYEMRAMTLARNPRSVSARRKKYAYILGKSYDPMDSWTNLPRFLEAELTSPTALRGMSWADHVRDWMDSPRENVSTLRYEDLLSQPQQVLTRVVAELTESQPPADLVDLAVARHSFSRTGRAAGDEDRTSFMRKGVSGDWRNHFSSEARAVFAHHAGDVLERLGYEGGTDWANDLGRDG